MSATNGHAFGATARGATMYALAAGLVLVFGAILYMALVLGDVDARALVLTAGGVLVTAAGTALGGKFTPTDQKRPTEATTPPEPVAPPEYTPEPGTGAVGSV